MRYTELPEANGMTRDGIIYISTSSENPALVVLAHEVTHNFKIQNPKKYQAYENYVIDYMKKYHPEEYKKTVRRLKTLYKINDMNAIHEEIACNITEEFLMNPDVIEKICKEDKTLAEKIVDFIKDLISKIEQLYKGYSPKSVEARVLKENLDTFNEALGLWMEAIGKGNNISIKHSLKNTGFEFQDTYKIERERYVNSDEYEKLLNEIKEFAEGKRKTSERINFGKTPEILLHLDGFSVKDLELQMNQSTLRKIQNGKKKTLPEEQHNIPSEELARLPFELSNPILVYRGSADNLIVVVTNIVDMNVQNENEVFSNLSLVSILLEGDQYYSINRITSAYGKRDMLKYLKQQEEAGKRLYPNKKRSLDKVLGDRVQFPELLTSDKTSFNNSIPKDLSNDNRENNEIKYSLKDDLETQVKEVLNNVNYSNTHVYLGATPENLIELGLEQRPMLMTSQHVYSTITDEATAKKQGRYSTKRNYHGMGKEKIIGLPDMIANAGMIIKSNTDANNADVVIVTNETDQNGDVIIVAIKPDGRGYFNQVDVSSNIIKSAYGKDNLNTYVKAALKEDRILVFDKLKSQKLMNIPRVQFPNNILVSDFTNNLTNYRKIVNSIIRKNMSDNAQVKKSLKDINQSIDLTREYEGVGFGEVSGILQNVTEKLKRTKIDPERIKRIADKLVKDCYSKYDSERLAKNLETMFTYLQLNDPPKMVHRSTHGYWM